jgi:ABC-type bacteriocin/lantibiotic exporter with double-glycine peptidase domain
VWPLGHRAIETSVGESRAKYAVAAWLEALARPGETFRGQGAATFARARADALAVRYLAARSDHFRIVLRQHVGTLGFRAVVSAALLGVGGLLVIQRGLTVGQLAAAELVVTGVVLGMTKLSKQLETAYDLAAAVDKLGHLADLPLERAGGAPVPAGSARGARLSLRGVSFGYGGAAVLRDAHLALEPGGRAAVLGASGSGKSTLADLLVGRRAPSAGAVLLEGADLRELSLDALRAAVAVVRDVALFEGTVAENVAVGRPGVDAAQVREALAAVGLGDIVLALPAGVDTPLIPGGAPLSMSQARRLMFARALAGTPRLLVVDGALDALDDDAASELLAALAAPGAPWTLLVLTHHASVAAACDTRVHLRDSALARA